LKTARHFRSDLKATLRQKLELLKERKYQGELSVEIDRLDNELATTNEKIEELGATVRSMEKHHSKEVDVLIAYRDTLRTSCSDQQKRIQELEVFSLDTCFLCIYISLTCHSSYL
jgi:chromosome segregation ATPase